MSKSIHELMQVTAMDRDPEWLKDSLQTAIELELSTIPPYLCGLWTVIADPSGTVTKLIRGIVLEEMVHLGIVCNLLVSLGGAPQLLSWYKQNIRYPGPLPGGVHPGLTVYLAGLTQDYVRSVYMQIELPEKPLALLESQQFATIGDFYDALSEAFLANNPQLMTAGQRTAEFGSINMSLAVVPTVDAARTAILGIKEQGEGTSTSMQDSPYTPDLGNGPELAHYYKFGEIAHGKLIKQQSDGTWDFNGDSIQLPLVQPMLPVPAGGYQNPSDIAKQALTEFNSTFSDLLQALDTAWGPGGTDDLLGDAINIMFQMKAKAQKLFAIPLPGGDGVYGPDFAL